MDAKLNEFLDDLYRIVARQLHDRGIERTPNQIEEGSEFTLGDNGHWLLWVDLPGVVIQCGEVDR